MDTRSKILTAEAAAGLAVRPIAIVAGIFDVLRVAHVRELEEARASCGAAALLVVLLPSREELLSQRARAELVAGLRVVDFVVAGGQGELEGLIRMLEPACVVDLRDLDARLRRELQERIGR